MCIGMYVFTHWMCSNNKVAVYHRSHKNQHGLRIKEKKALFVIQYDL